MTNHLKEHLVNSNILLEYLNSYINWNSVNSLGQTKIENWE